jgi:hypothetical protein
MVVVAWAVVVIARKRGLPRAPAKRLKDWSLWYAAIGLMGSLALCIGAMAWLQASTGIDQGNGPLGWIFLYGPASAGLGQFIALVRWWCTPVNSLVKAV